MSVYATEEEQLEAIKKFFKKHQNILSIILLGMILGTAGYRYWCWHHDKVFTQASSIYERVMVAFSKQDKPAVSAYTQTLIKDYPNTIYSEVALLLKAHEAVSEQRWEDALSALSNVIEHGKLEALKTEALFRSARILIFLGRSEAALAQLKKINEPVYHSRVERLIQSMQH